MSGRRRPLRNLLVTEAVLGAGLAVAVAVALVSFSQGEGEGAFVVFVVGVALVWALLLVRAAVLLPHRRGRVAGWAGQLPLLAFGLLYLDLPPRPVAVLVVGGLLVAAAAVALPWDRVAARGR